MACGPPPGPPLGSAQRRSPVRVAFGSCAHGPPPLGRHRSAARSDPRSATGGPPRCPLPDLNRVGETRARRRSGNPTVKPLTCATKQASAQETTGAGILGALARRARSAAHPAAGRRCGRRGRGAAGRCAPGGGGGGGRTPWIGEAVAPSAGPGLPAYPGISSTFLPPGHCMPSVSVLATLQQFAWSEALRPFLLCTSMDNTKATT